MSLRSRYPLTVDKREIKDFPKLPSAISFIREPLYAKSAPKKNTRPSVARSLSISNLKDFQFYFKRIPIPDKARGDAFHLAVATYHGMDFLVSWNFTHILSARVRAVIQDINAIRGISTPIICTPEELMDV